MDYYPIYLSFKLAMVTTLILVFLACPMASLLAYSQFRGKPFFEALVNLPLVLPPTVLGYYLLLFMGPRGPMGALFEGVTGERLIFSFPGIVLASLVYSLPFAVQPLKNAFERLDTRLIETAYVLGLSRTKTFFRMILPNSVGGLMVAIILTFAHTMGEFGVVLMVGGSIPKETKVASIAIYEYVESLRYHEANIISLLLSVLSYLVLVLVFFLNGRERRC